MIHLQHIRRMRRWALGLGWPLVLAMTLGATCPATVPPATLPLPSTADPPKSQEIRAVISTGVGGDTKGSIYSGGAVRGTYAPLRSMLIGVELGGGARHNSAAADEALGVKRDVVISSRLLVGYGFWLYRRYLSLAAEGGLTPGLHSKHGGFIGPDATLTISAGGLRWWALSASYRLAYMVPTRDEDWAPALYHIAALTLLIPRRATYGFYLQTGFHYGHRIPSYGRSVGVTGAIGFRFTYGH